MVRLPKGKKDWHEDLLRASRLRYALAVQKNRKNATRWHRAVQLLEASRSAVFLATSGETPEIRGLPKGIQHEIFLELFRVANEEIPIGVEGLESGGEGRNAGHVEIEDERHFKNRRPRDSMYAILASLYCQTSDSNTWIPTGAVKNQAKHFTDEPIDFNYRAGTHGIWKAKDKLLELNLVVQERGALAAEHRYKLSEYGLRFCYRLFNEKFPPPEHQEVRPRCHVTRDGHISATPLHPAAPRASRALTTPSGSSRGEFTAEDHAGYYLPPAKRSRVGMEVDEINTLLALNDVKSLRLGKLVLGSEGTRRALPSPPIYRSTPSHPKPSPSSASSAPLADFTLPTRPSSAYMSSSSRHRDHGIDAADHVAPILSPRSTGGRGPGRGGPSGEWDDDFESKVESFTEQGIAREDAIVLVRNGAADEPFLDMSEAEAAALLAYQAHEQRGDVGDDDYDDEYQTAVAISLTEVEAEDNGGVLQGTGAGGGGRDYEALVVASKGKGQGLAGGRYDFGDDADFDISCYSEDDQRRIMEEIQLTRPSSSSSSSSSSFRKSYLPPNHSSSPSSPTPPLQPVHHYQQTHHEGHHRPARGIDDVALDHSIAESSCDFDVAAVSDDIIEEQIRILGEATRTRGTRTRDSVPLPARASRAAKGDNLRPVPKAVALPSSSSSSLSSASYLTTPPPAPGPSGILTLDLTGDDIVRVPKPLTSRPLNSIAILDLTADSQDSDLGFDALDADLVQSNMDDASQVDNYVEVGGGGVGGVGAGVVYRDCYRGTSARSTARLGYVDPCVTQVQVAASRAPKSRIRSRRSRQTGPFADQSFPAPQPVKLHHVIPPIGLTLLVDARERRDQVYYRKLYHEIKNKVKDEVPQCSTSEATLQLGDFHFAYVAGRRQPPLQRRPTSSPSRPPQSLARTQTQGVGGARVDEGNGDDDDDVLLASHCMIERKTVKDLVQSSAEYSASSSRHFKQERRLRFAPVRHPIFLIEGDYLKNMDRMPKPLTHSDMCLFNPDVIKDGDEIGMYCAEVIARNFDARHRVYVFQTNEGQTKLFVASLGRVLAKGEHASLLTGTTQACGSSSSNSSNDSARSSSASGVDGAGGDGLGKGGGLGLPLMSEFGRYCSGWGATTRGREAQFISALSAMSTQAHIHSSEPVVRITGVKARNGPTAARDGVDNDEGMDQDARFSLLRRRDLRDDADVCAWDDIEGDFEDAVEGQARREVVLRVHRRFGDWDGLASAYAACDSAWERSLLLSDLSVGGTEKNREFLTHRDLNEAPPPSLAGAVRRRLALESCNIWKKVCEEASLMTSWDLERVVSMSREVTRQRRTNVITSPGMWQLLEASEGCPGHITMKKFTEHSSIVLPFSFALVETVAENVDVDSCVDFDGDVMASASEPVLMMRVSGTFAVEALAGACDQAGPGATDMEIVDCAMAELRRMLAQSFDLVPHVMGTVNTTCDRNHATDHQREALNATSLQRVLVFDNFVTSNSAHGGSGKLSKCISEAQRDDDSQFVYVRPTPKKRRRGKTTVAPVLDITGDDVVPPSLVRHEAAGEEYAMTVDEEEIHLLRHPTSFTLKAAKKLQARFQWLAHLMFSRLQVEECCQVFQCKNLQEVRNFIWNVIHSCHRQSLLVRRC